jgi:hypothetical protein
MLEDLFNKKPLKRERMICHSGGAVGSDTVWEQVGEEFGIKTNAYSYKTKSHTTPNKVEISDDDYNEGVQEINRANKHLKRYGIHKYMSLLARNWAQVKYSKQIFAIGSIVKSGGKDSKGYYNKSEFDIVSGGTGYCVMMGILNEREVYVFDQNLNKWFRWSHNSLRFIELKEVPKITDENFAGVGTREINPSGVRAIRDVYENTFN